MKTTLKYFLAIWFLVLSFAAQAAPSPVDMVQQVTNQMLSELQKMPNRTTQSLYSMVRRLLLPHVDLDLMSEQVVGGAWAKATPAQRKEFINQFTYFVTRTYSAAFASYTDQKVKVLPLRGNVTSNRAQVNSLISQKNGSDIAVSYKLILDNGQWKVFDVSVEGVSLVLNYRSQFEDVIRTKGLSGLNEQLKSYNAGMK